MDEFLFVDVETTGLDPEADRIVEIGWCDQRGMGDYQLIDPGMPIPPQASGVHHITDEMVRTAPTTLPEITARHYVAHGSRFEAAFLPELGPWIDTYRCALRAWPDAPDHKLQTLRYWLGLRHIPGVGHLQPHRALYDAVVASQVFGRLLDAECTLEQMLEWSIEPAVLRVVGFGKHGGKPWSEVPRDYLRWILTQDFDEDVIHTARYHLGEGRLL